MFVVWMDENNNTNMKCIVYKLDSNHSHMVWNQIKIRFLQMCWVWMVRSDLNSFFIFWIICSDRQHMIKYLIQISLVFVVWMGERAHEIRQFLQTWYKSHEYVVLNQIKIRFSEMRSIVSSDLNSFFSLLGCNATRILKAKWTKTSHWIIFQDLFRQAAEIQFSIWYKSD